MKRFSRKISVIFLVALLALTLVGCSSTAKASEPEIVAPVKSSSSTAPAAPSAPTQEKQVYPFGVVEIEKNNAGDKDFDLFIVHTNDVHARVVPQDGGMGYAKLATLLNMGRDLTDNLLILDAGDVTHGTNFANFFNGETIFKLLDILGYDAIAPGNHDFNYGYKTLVENAEKEESSSNLKVLAANVLDNAGYLIFQPYQVYDFNGFKVSVVGLATPDTKVKAHPKNTEGIEFEDFMSKEGLDLAQSYLDQLNSFSDLVIVLGHIGLDPDGPSGLVSEYLAKNLNGIDLFVDGHSHTVLPEGKKVGDTLIVSTGEYLKNVGVVEIQVRDGKVNSITPVLISAEEVMDPSKGYILSSFGITNVPDDPKVNSYITDVNSKLQAKLDQVVATIPTDLDGARENVRTKSTNLASLICKGMTEAGNADFTITNGGGIRASLKKGDVTLGDINNVLPFTNTISVCEITPKEVYAALEFGYRMLPEQNGGFPQTDLLVLTNKSAKEGSRIVRVILDGKTLDRNDDKTIYKVATNDFLAAGGDGFTMFGKEILVGPMLNEVFAAYLAELYPPQN